MADRSTHINYSFEDIQRYLQGKMSAAEMHAIEKAALQDPFLADAIEGYTDADVTIAKQHLNEINAGLFAEKQKSKVITFNNTSRWLSIAAIVIVLTGVGLLGAYILKGSNKQQQVAQVKKAPEKSMILKDSVTTTLNVPPEKKEEPVITEDQTKSKTTVTAKKEVAKQSAPAGKNKQSAEADAATITASPAPVPEHEYAPRSLAAQPLSNRAADTSKIKLRGKVSGVNTDSNTFSGKVVDETNNPIPFASIQSIDEKADILTNVEGNFNLQKNDSLLNVTAYAVGYESRSILLKQGVNNLIVLKVANSNLNEVVVTPAKAKRKTHADSVMPVGGWYNFNHYVMLELDKDSIAGNGMSTNDVVELEFLVDKSGNPYNIKIIKSMDDRRNAKAIEILKSGPKWKNTSKNKKAKVAINF